MKIAGEQLYLVASVERMNPSANPIDREYD